MQDSIKTTCPYCGVGCGLLVRMEADGQVKVQGDPEHPANRGRLCSKGSALAETLGTEGRLLHPRIGGRRVGWDQALDRVAETFRRVIDEHGPDAMAFYVSGQLLTEEYYVANKLMKGFIGSANIDTNSRLCMSSAVAGHKRAFGSDTVPVGYEDLEKADLVTLVGSNAAWCHPVLFQRLRDAKRERPDMRIVVVDPRRTPTCDIADLHLPLRPGSDVGLFNALLWHLDRSGGVDWSFVVNHTEGFGEALEQARRGTSDPLSWAAKHCELDPNELRRFFGWFGQFERSVTLFSQGVNQWAHGTDKVNAIINCHLATGRIGISGAGPFSITGQPNAMGGREVGGLANQLAAHMDFSDADRERVGRFWSAARLADRPGLKAVDLFRAVEKGRIKALWVMATNPAVSTPDADRVRAALRSCETLVVSDCVADTDTAACADILLPAAAWGEKAGMVTNSERCISRQRPFLTAPGEARPDWWIVTEVARRMGFAEAFPYREPLAILREYAALTQLDNGGARDLDLGVLAELDQAGYDGWQPARWPLSRQGVKPPPFSDRRFFTPSGRARFVPVGATGPANAVDTDYPLVLNTGRVRDQWHTMTRTARAPRLVQHRPEPTVEISGGDALHCGLRDGALARLSSRWGEMVARVSFSDAQRPGSVFVPMHWSDAFGPRARVDALVNPVTDPVSGQPEFKHTPVRIEALQPAWHGFLMCRGRPALPEDLAYRMRANGGDHGRYELAGEQTPESWTRWAREVLGGDGEWIEFQDAAEGRYRCAQMVEGRLQACLFIERTESAPGREWLARLFEAPDLDAGQRASLLAGRPRDGHGDVGRTVCSCFNVGINTLRTAISEQGLTTVEAIGDALRAGTNCGSCIPELRGLLGEGAGTVAA